MPNRPRARRRGLFVLVFMIIILAGAYTGYWFYMANQLKTGVIDWIDDQRALGYQMQHDSLKMTGFPYRFHLVVEKPAVTTPDGAWVWQGEQLDLVMQTYNFQHVIGYSPGSHIIQTANGEIINAEAVSLQASFRWNSESLQRVSIVSEGVNATASGEPYTLAGFHLHLRPMPERPDNIQIKAGFEQLSLPEPIADAEWLGTDIGPISAPIEIINGVPLMNASGDIKNLVRQFEPQLVSPLTELSWGPAIVKLKSEGLALDEAYRPAGKVELRVEDISKLKEALEDADKMNPQLNTVLSTVESMTGETAFIPITLKDGKAKHIFLELGEVSPVL